MSRGGRILARHGPERVLLPVHLAADDGEEGLAVDEDADAVLLDDLVELCGAVDVLERVGEAGAAFVPDADADELGRRAAHEDAEAFDGGGCLCRGGAGGIGGGMRMKDVDI